MKKIILLVLCLFPATLFAQSAADYFHKSANYYVNANKKSAQATVEEGINKFPNDQKLKDLASKIEELPDPEEDEQNQNQQNQDNQDQQDQEQQDQKKDETQQQQISREDAQRILDAIAQEEKELQEKLQKKEQTGQRQKIEKNW